MRRVWAILLFTLAVPLSAAQEQAPERQRPEDLASLLPEGTLLMIECDDLGGWAARSRESAIGRILSDPEMQAFLQPLHESIHKALVNFTSVADAPAMLGLSWEDFQGIEIQRAGFAVADLSTDWWPVPDMLLTLQFRKGGDKAQKIVAALQDAAANSGAAFEEIEVRGRKVMHGRIQSVDLFMGMGGDRLFITTRKARIEQIYAARDGELPKSLAASTRFKQIIDTMGAQRRGFLLYADVKRGLQQVVPMATAGSDRARAEVEQHLALSGFDKVEALAIADIPAGTGYRSELALTMSERTGFLAVLESGAADHRFAKHVPRDALLYAGEKSDLAGLWDRAVAWMATIDPRVGQKIQENVAHLNRELGLDLRRELLGSLGDQWGVYVDTPPGGGLIPDLVLFASLRDRARAERTIDLLVARLSDAAASDHITLKRGATEFRGTTIHYLELSHGDEPIPIMPAWAFGEDYCISALYPQSIKHALMEKPSLASNPRFRLLRETAPAGATSLTYVDSPRIAGWLYNTFVPILQGTQGAINSEIGKWGVQLNFHDLPPASVITRHMQAGGMYWVCGDDHLRLGTVSSFPGTLLAIPATAMLAASVMYVSRVEHDAPFVRELDFGKAPRPVPEAAPPDARYRELAERMGRLEAEIAQLRAELERANK